MEALNSKIGPTSHPNLLARLETRPDPAAPSSTRAASARATGFDPSDAFVPAPGIRGPALSPASTGTSGDVSSLRTEDADDGKTGCLDNAVDFIRGLPPDEKAKSELVLLADNRPGAEGTTGHVVVKQGDSIVDPSTRQRFANAGAYLSSHPEYSEKGRVSAQNTERIFATAPGSPERQAALEKAGVPVDLRNMRVADSSPLGPPVEGVVCVAPPEPKAWTPADQGAGRHGSEFAGPKDRAVKVAAEGGAASLSGKWPDASRNLLHFLGNSGKPLTQDVDKMLREVPGLDQAVKAEQTSIADAAIKDAKARGCTGPVTYPVQTNWDGYYISPDQSENWYYALGGVNHSQTGQVTVYPPEKPGDQWRYEIDTQVHIRDQYNWDGGKSTQIGPLTITDESLAALHRGGIAQEFMATGTSSLRTGSGQMP
jgi:hypothetical protein